MHRLLLIDGDYFANRVIGYLNMGDQVNHLITKNEIDSFKGALNQSLISLYSTFSPFIDNMIFVKDNSSWRKEIPGIKPYYIADERPIEYKEQRIEKKEESPIDYVKFREVYAEFVENISTLIPVFNIKGLEGDDNLMLLSNKFAGKQVESYIFCTDGDMMQVVKDNCFLMRNIKSKASPSGDWVMTYKKYLDIFESDVKQQLISGGNNDFYRRLFQISITQNTKVSRSLNSGIDIATPFKVALIKSICGDKKDNLFSILSWKAKTGTMMYKLTEKIIEKTLKKSNLMLTENTCQAILSDKEQLINLVLQLIGEYYPECSEDKEKTKEKTKAVFNHLKHNLRLNILAPSNVPEHYIAAWEEAFTGQEAQIMTKVDYMPHFKKLTVTKKDSAINILENSLPDELIN